MSTRHCICRRCGQPYPVSLRRKFCFRCVPRRKQVQKRLPSITRRNAADERIRQAEALLPTVSTGPLDAPPCSPRRLAALIARADAGVPLFDRRDWLDGEVRPVPQVREEVDSDDE